MKRKFLTISNSQGKYPLSHKAIFHIESKKDYCVVHTEKGEKHLHGKNIGAVKKQLHGIDFFVMTHKSHIINIHKLKILKGGDGATAIMENGSSVPIAKRRRAYINKLLK